MNFFKLFKESSLDITKTISSLISSNLRNFAWMLEALSPYLMYLIANYNITVRRRFAVGSEILIPVIIMIIVYYLRSFSNKLGKGSTVPVPKERFTEIDEDGEVSVRNDRVQELILYLADLEDWMERKGML